MSYGLLAEGFRRKTYDVIVSEMQTKARDLYGNDVNLSDNSPLGLFIQNIAYFLASGDTEDQGLWELAENVYYSPYIDTSENNSLDSTVKNIGIKRRQAESSISPSVVLNCVPGTVVPAGFLGTTPGGIRFFTTQQVTSTGETATVDMQAVDGGSHTNVPANTITVIVNPIAGVISINNPNPAAGGRDTETDEELRDRYIQSISNPGASTTDSIRAALLKLEGVRGAIVRKNDTMSTVSDIPPKSIAPIVFGGTDADIADAILKTKAGGIQSYGTTIVSVADLSGNSHAIGFTRPTIINVWVNVTLTTNSNFPIDGAAQVRTEIIKYIGGQNEDLTEYNGLTLGDDVIWGKCIAAAYTVAGIIDVALSLSTDGSMYNQSNISIGSSEIARTDYSKVVIF